MKTLTLALTVVLCHSSYGALHPVLVDPSITRCEDAIGLTCNHNVYYSAAGTNLVDIPETVGPVVGGSTTLIAVGVHCGHGSSLQGIPFSTCAWNNTNLAHAPEVANCRLSSSASWQLSPSSTCALSRPTWGPHAGAEPGGECVLFVQASAKLGSDSAIRTIYGDLTATQVANAGSSFCQKALPPAQTCEIDLPAVIDHGAIGTADRNEVVVEGTVDCGPSPLITVLGGNAATMGPGVASDLTLQLVDQNRIRVTSTVRSIDALPGDYNVTRVVIASPY